MTAKRRCKCRLCYEAREFGRKRPPRCPKCGHHPRVYQEFYDGFSSEFMSDPDSGRIDAEGEHLNTGNPTRVFATCACGHRWRIRGAIQITNIPGHPDYEP